MIAGPHTCLFARPRVCAQAALGGHAHGSRPTAPGRYPGVIVIMEAFGLNDHIKDVARRFAEQGYCALAPDMYTREGAPDPTVMEQVLTTMFSVPDTQAVADLEGAI